MNLIAFSGIRGVPADTREAAAIRVLQELEYATRPNTMVSLAREERRLPQEVVDVLAGFIFTPAAAGGDNHHQQLLDRLLKLHRHMQEVNRRVEERHRAIRSRSPIPHLEQPTVADKDYLDRQTVILQSIEKEIRLVERQLTGWEGRAQRQRRAEERQTRESEQQTRNAQREMEEREQQARKAQREMEKEQQEREALQQAREAERQMREAEQEAEEREQAALRDSPAAKREKVQELLQHWMDSILNSGASAAQTYSFASKTAQQALKQLDMLAIRRLLGQLLIDVSPSPRGVSAARRQAAQRVLEEWTSIILPGAGAGAWEEKRRQLQAMQNDLNPSAKSADKEKAQLMLQVCDSRLF